MLVLLIPCVAIPPPPNILVGRQVLRERPDYFEAEGDQQAGEGDGPDADETQYHDLPVYAIVLIVSYYQ